LHLTIPYPDRERELSIVRLRVPGVDASLASAVVNAVQKIRTFDLRKVPSVSEVIDWTRALGLLGRNTIDEGTLADTLGVLIKHKDDAALVLTKRNDVVSAASP
jgi:MoxR-like ATPase